MTPEDQRKPLKTFALHALFGLVLLNAIPTASTAYPLVFAWLGNVGFELFAGEHRAEFEWIAPADRKQGAEVKMSGFASQQEAPLWEMGFSVFDRGYRPTVAFLALMLATPMAIPRKLFGLTVGFAIYHGFLLAVLGAIAGGLFSTVEPEVFGTTLTRLQPVVEGFFGSVIPRYVMALALWAGLGRPEQRIDFSEINRRLGGLINRGTRDSEHDEDGSD